LTALIDTPASSFKVEAEETAGTETSGRLLVTYADGNDNVRKFFQTYIESKGLMLLAIVMAATVRFICVEKWDAHKKGRTPSTPGL
jgi:hypothetical protein